MPNYSTSTYVALYNPGLWLWWGAGEENVKEKLEYGRFYIISIVATSRSVGEKKKISFSGSKENRKCPLYQHCYSARKGIKREFRPKAETTRRRVKRKRDAKMRKQATNSTTTFLFTRHRVLFYRFYINSCKYRIVPFALLRFRFIRPAWYSRRRLFVQLLIAGVVLIFVRTARPSRPSLCQG